MGERPLFRCPQCRQTFHGGALQAHLLARPEERAKLFRRYASEPDVELLGVERCGGLLEIVPLMDAEETLRFGAAERVCGREVVRCPCGGSHCHHHTFNCISCGRFACLRHRWSGRCPRCALGQTSRPVKIDKFDPFSKQRSTFIRTYPRAGRPDVWHVLEE